MADLEWMGEPERPSLRRAIRHRLRRFDPTVRVVAEGFLAESSAIDLLAVGAEGDLISIRIGWAENDAALLTRVLSDLTWLRPRSADLLKLAPGLGLEPSAEPRALLFCPEFGSETRAAVENFPARTITLIGYRCLRQRGQLNVFFETLKAPLQAAATHPADPAALPERHASATPQAAAAPSTFASGPGMASNNRDRSATTPSSPRAPSRLTDPPSHSSFRTGLSDDDLRSEPIEEEKALD